jgi:hypothetical protein
MSKSKTKKGYFFTTLSRNKKKVIVGNHRLVALAFIPNPENKPQVDHINGIKTDNNSSNLRWATNSENHMNLGLLKSNTSGVRGVHRKRNKWHASIEFNNKKYSLGSYNTIEEAAEARSKKASELYGTFMHHIENIKTEIQLLEVAVNNI